MIRSTCSIGICIAVVSAARPMPSIGGEPLRVLPAPPAATVAELPPAPLPPIARRAKSLRPESLRPESLRPESLRPESLRPELSGPKLLGPKLAKSPSVERVSAKTVSAGGSYAVRPASAADAMAEALLSTGGPPMTLESFERIALANNPTLVQADARLRAARAFRIQQGLYPNPTVGYIAEEIGNEGSRGQQGGFVRQEFVTAGKLKLRENVAGHQVVEAQHAYQTQRRRVVADVRRAWYEVVVAGRVVELNRKLLNIAGEVAAAAEDLLKAKEVGRVDVLQAEIEVGSARLKLNEAENRLKTSRRRLAILVGMPDMELGPIAGSLEDDLPPLDWAASLARLRTESPQLAEARSAVERARCAVASETAQRTPNVDVRAAVQYDDAVGDSYASVELGMPLPIFNRNQGNICRARAELLGARKEVERLELALQSELAAAFGRYREARHDVNRYATEILPKAEQSLDLVRGGYRDGEYDYLTLLTAQRTFFKAGLAHLESLLQWHTSRVAIEQFLLGGGLDARR